MNSVKLAHQQQSCGGKRLRSFAKQMFLFSFAQKDRQGRNNQLLQATNLPSSIT